MPQPSPSPFTSFPPIGLQGKSGKQMLFSSDETPIVPHPHSLHVIQTRETVTTEILTILNDRYPDGSVPAHMSKEMPSFAVKLEDAIFRRAENFSEYADLSTLKIRMKVIAKEMFTARHDVTGCSSKTKDSLPLPHRPSHLQQQHEDGTKGHQQSSKEYQSNAVRQQIQRILLLRHASTCPHIAGSCSKTPHCAALKVLWSHLSTCSDSNCQIRHCISSRYLLSHYARCQSTTCPVCLPVRTVIKRKRVTNTIDIGVNGEVAAASTADSDLLENKKTRLNEVASCGQSQLVNPAPSSPSPRLEMLEDGTRRELLYIIEYLFRIPHTEAVFGSPVDPLAMQLHDYQRIVTEPMDLGTVYQQLQQQGQQQEREVYYKQVEHVIHDVHLTFDNAMRYNRPGTDVFALAQCLRREFDFLCRQRVWSLFQTGELDKCDLTAVISGS